MPFEHDRSSLDGSHGGAAHDAAGKRTLTERIQRSPSRDAGAAAVQLKPAADESSWTEPPLSSDVSYLDSVLAGPVQRKGNGKAPTAGPSWEDRGDVGELPASVPDARNLRARVVGREVVKGGTRLTITAGWKLGVRAGMHGHLVDAAGKVIADFTIDDVQDTFAFAHTDEHHQDTIKGALQVVVNPS
jgi:hypothetical protein